jgi:hypothetical protein
MKHMRPRPEKISRLHYLLEATNVGVDAPV